MLSTLCKGHLKYYVPYLSPGPSVETKGTFSLSPWHSALSQLMCIILSYFMSTESTTKLGGNFQHTSTIAKSNICYEPIAKSCKNLMMQLRRTRILRLETDATQPRMELPRNK